MEDKIDATIKWYMEVVLRHQVVVHGC